MAVERLQHVGDVRDQAVPRCGLAEALRLAGFALAHAAMSVEHGDETQTIAVIARNGSIQRLTRYAAADIASSLRAARGHLAHELGETNQAALAHSGSFLVGNRYRRVLIVEVLGPHGVLLGRVVQPYRRRRFRVVVLRKVRRFAVLGPPIIDHLVVDAQSRELQNGLAEVESRIYWGVYDHPHGLRLFKRPMRSRSRRR